MTALHLVGLEERNVLRVRAIELTFGPGGELVVIGGRNAQGKSSALKAIEMTLGGGAHTPAEPVRRGATKGGTKLTLRDREGNGYDVELKLTKDGGRTLVVTKADGSAVRSPQALLDGFLGAIAFDPLSFARLAGSPRAVDRKEAADVLRGLVGLDLSDVDAEIARARDDRTEAGRAVKVAQAQLAGAVRHSNAPAEEESVAGLRAKLDEKRAQHERCRDAWSSARALLAAAEDSAARVSGAAEAVEAAERALEAARREHARVVSEAMRAREDGLAALEVAEGCDVEGAERAVREAEAELDSVDERNAHVRANRDYHAKRKALDAAEKLHEDASNRIEAAEEKRRARLAAAKWPIEGLGFDDDGMIRFGGIPFDQASTAERVRVSLAVGMALNPMLRLLLVREGNDLDDDALAEVARMAERHDCKVLLERVGKGDEVAVVIEDGEVAEDRREGAH